MATPNPFDQFDNEIAVNPFDQFDNLDDGVKKPPWYSDAALSKNIVSGARTAKDIGVGFLKAPSIFANSLYELANLATGVLADVGARGKEGVTNLPEYARKQAKAAGVIRPEGDFQLYTLDEGTEALFGKSLSQYFGETSQILSRLESDEMQGKKQKLAELSESDDGFFRNLWEGTKFMATNPSLAANVLAESSAMMLGMGGAIKSASQKAYTAAISKGLTEEAAKAAANKAAIQAGVASNALIEGSSVSMGTRQEIMDTPTESMNDLPLFQYYLQRNGGDKEKAKRQMAEFGARTSFAIASTIGGAATRLTGGGIDIPLFGGKGVDSGIFGFIKSIGKESIEEAVQEGPGNILGQNIAKAETIEPGRDYFKGLGTGVATGLVTGAVGGTGGYLLSGRADKGGNKSAEIPPVTGAPFTREGTPTAIPDVSLAVRTEQRKRENEAAREDETIITRVMSAESVDAAIQAADDALTGEVAKYAQLDVAQKEHEDAIDKAFQDYEDRLTRQRETDYQRLQSESQVPKAEYDDTVAAKAGRLDKQPTAMELALQKAGVSRGTFAQRLTPTASQETGTEAPLSTETAIPQKPAPEAAGATQPAAVTTARVEPALPEPAPLSKQEVLKQAQAQKRARKGEVVKLEGDQANTLRNMASQSGWSERGGLLLRQKLEGDAPTDATGPVIGRTKWIPKAEWWPDFARDKSVSMKPEQLQAAVDKAATGQTLRPKEARAVKWLLDKSVRQPEMEQFDEDAYAEDPAWVTADQEPVSLEPGEEREAFDIVQKGLEIGLDRDTIDQLAERAAIQGLSNAEILKQLESARTAQAKPADAESPATDQIAAEARVPASQTPAGQVTPTEEVLTTYTEADLQRQEEAKARQAETDRKATEKAEADAAVGQFVLAGSKSNVDQAEARGQKNLFDTKPSTALTKPQKMVAVWGNKKYPVTSLQDAVNKWDKFRDTTDAGASEIGNGVTIYDQENKVVAKISYNGRIWDAAGKEIPQPGVETAEDMQKRWEAEEALDLDQPAKPAVDADQVVTIGGYPVTGLGDKALRAASRGAATPEERQAAQDEIDRRTLLPIGSGAEMKARAEASQQAEREAVAITKDMDGFMADKTPMEQGRASTALNINLSNQGRVISRKELMREKVAAGAAVVTGKNGRRLQTPDGSYLDEKQISKTAMDYAEHLIAQKTTEQPTAAPIRDSRVYLDVPFTSKDFAKDRGARWDSENKLWYAVPVKNRSTGESIIALSLTQYVPNTELAAYSKQGAKVVALNKASATGVEYVVNQSTKHPAEWTVSAKSADQVVKEPWQMTAQEFRSEQVKGQPEYVVRNQGNLARDFELHKELVQDAIDRGETVPDEVLAGYPELKPVTKPEGPPVTKDNVVSIVERLQKKKNERHKQLMNYVVKNGLQQI